MNTPASAVRPLWLMCFCLLVAQPAKAENLAQLLLTLEQNTRYEAQTAAWRENREAWVDDVNAATRDNQVPALMERYAASLMPESLSEAWPARKPAWSAELGRATKRTDIARLLVELERYVLPVAFNESWNEDRNDWITQVWTSEAFSSRNMHRDEALAEPAGEDVEVPEPVAAPAEVETVREALRTLENNTQYLAQTDAWFNSGRTRWLVKLNTSTTAASVAKALAEFEKNMKPESFSPSWKHLQSTWRKQAKRARTAAQVAQAIASLEIYTTNAAMSAGWVDETRVEWAVGLMRAAGAPNPAALPREDRSPVQNPDAHDEEHPFSDEAQAQQTVWLELAELIREVEVNTPFTSQVEGWQENRGEWAGLVTSAQSTQDLAKILAGYFGSLNAAVLSPGFNATDWRASLQNPANVAAVAQAAIALEQGLNQSMLSESWAERRSAWAAALREAAERADRGEIGEAATPTDATVNLDNLSGIPLISELIRKMEANISFGAQADNWPDLRIAWIENARNAANPADVANVILKFETAMKPESMNAGWAARRDAWKAALGQAQSLAAVAPLLIELEEAIADDAFFGIWPAEAAGWIAHVQRSGN